MGVDDPSDDLGSELRANPETDDTCQTGLENQVVLAQIEQVSEGVREKAETFEEGEEAI